MTGREFGALPEPEGQWPGSSQGAGATPPQQPAVPPGYGPGPGRGPGYGLPGQPGVFGPPLPQPLPPVRPPVPAPAGGGGGRRSPFKGRPAVLVAASVVGLLLIGGGVYAAVGSGGDKPGKGTAKGTESATPSGSPSVDQGDGKGAGSGPDAYDPNAGIKDGEARVWLSDNKTELPGSGVQQYGPWRVGDVVAKAMFKEVTALGVADGKEKWKLSLDTPLCGVPQAPSANGKLVVGVLDNDSAGAHCTHLQQIDLTTGKVGWKVEVPKENAYDSNLTLDMVISGDTVAVARSAVMSGFSVTDGKKLFGTSKTGGCFPSGFGGGARLIVERLCPEPNDATKMQTMIEELDPATGAPKWNYTYEKGWKLGRIYSMDPLVTAAYQPEEKTWSITAFAADGKVRSQTVSKFGVDKRCNGWGDGTNGPHYCDGAVVDADTLYIAGGKPGPELGIDKTDEVVAVDLNTGQEKWHAPSPKGRTIWPLAIENGKIVAYVEPGGGEAGAIVTLPTSGGTPEVVLQSPAAAEGAESVFYSHGVRMAWSDGRIFLLNGRVSSPEPKKVDRALLSFAKVS
ncbi:PQQ-binding-like beta-propeller repeat protein [Streptomyces sp. NBC_01565]|uniref:outer membrane protein assembly factor BamB family protein n=1 Tax=unclassified Streptomyces TaxID=2593676 RepID=UPI00224E6BB6|nr:PQQ-binding-like beta-propeller repeat protein [Streptomyces sp. NBC_01565]MCX4545528.1 PQQ-binding-like beta-propeller repeat protein [Streptomyces sp. NBC_01565]